MTNLSGADQYAGTYRFDDGRRLLLLATPDGMPAPLACFEGDHASWARPGDDGAFLSDWGFQLRPSAAGDGTRWFERSKHGAVERAVFAPEHTEREITFQSGDVTLAGTLLAPVSGGPHPVVLFVAGSGRVSRRSYGIPACPPVPYLLPPYGVASFIYDKRGTGSSTGDLNRASLEDVVADARSAVECLKQQPEVDTRAIGMWGISQGGWIAPLVATQTADVGYLVLVSAPATSIEQQELDRVEFMVRTGRFGEDAVEQALAHTRLFFDVVRTDTHWEELRASTEQHKAAEWWRYAGPPQGKGGVEWFRRWQYDPTETLARLTCPVLALYGELDIAVPPSRNTHHLASALNRAGNGDYTIRVFPDASHQLLLTDRETWYQEPPEKRYAAGAIQLMIDWLVQQGVRCRRTTMRDTRSASPGDAL